MNDSLSNSSFSRWPGAWERHLIRRQECPQYFEGAARPTATDMTNAQLKDQQELAQFHNTLESLIARCLELTDDACTESIIMVKKDLDICHDTAFGLATDLSDQKNAISSLNAIITASMQRTLNSEDEISHLQLAQKEAARKEKLHRLEFPIVCDLLRSVCPIPSGEVTGALLSETDSAYKAALETFDKNRKAYLAQRIDIIIADLDSEKYKLEAVRKLELLHKQLRDTPVPEPLVDESAAM